MKQTPIIISVYDAHKSDQAIIDTIDKRLDDSQISDNSDIKARITTLPTSAHLIAADYYILDDHLKPSGHQ